MGLCAPIFLHIPKLNIFDGKYSLSYSLMEGVETLDYVEDAVGFEILPEQIPGLSENVITRSYNLIYTPCYWIYD